MKNYLNYQDKVCVVTGAASGMGKATAEMLVDLGAKVYALDWAEVQVEGITASIHTDLSQKDSIDAAFANIPQYIDCFFGIAGVSGAKCDFLTTTKIDLIANKYICEVLLPARMSRGGSISFITSTAGNDWQLEGNKALYLPVVQAKGWEGAVAAVEASPLHYLPGFLGYPFSKLAMNYYTIAIQKEYAPKGIRVNAVLPGSTDTGLKGEFAQMAGGEESLLTHTGYAGRLAVSREMAEPIVFLGSDMASYISGELMTVDYGCSASQRAGIEPAQPAIDFAAILAQMQQAAQGQGGNS